MLPTEEKELEQLVYLKEKYQLAGVKAEFEEEGATFRDIIRLRKLTDLAGVKLHVKIGGVAAIRDIKDCYEIGVDGIIAPMAETKFGVKKFISAYQSVYNGHKVHLSINIETRNAVEELDDILDYSVDKLDNITLGRSDLSLSYFDKNVIPDSDFILNIIKEVSKKVVDAGLTFTVGGSISKKTIIKLREDPSIVKNVKQLETRKVILPRDVMLKKDNAVEEALKFEEMYILDKKHLFDVMIAQDVSRLDKLSKRK